MRKRRKVITCLLVVALCLSSVLGNMGIRKAEAALKKSGDWSYYVLKDGTVEIYSFNGNKKKVSIPKEIDGKLVSTIDTSFAFSACGKLESLEIPSGVKRISKEAFYECGKLKEIKVAEENKTYDSRDNCNGVIETGTNTLVMGGIGTKIPSSVTKIGEDAFLGSNLESIEIPSSITSIGPEAFYACKKLKNIEIPSSVTDIGYMAFGFCRSLENIEIPSSVTRIGYEAFMYCKKLQSIEIPSSVKNMGYETFWKCKELKSVKIAEGVTKIGDFAFAECVSLKSVEMPSSLKRIGDDSFSFCISLESIEIPEGVTSIEMGAFEYCFNLKEVTIHSEKLKKVDINVLNEIDKEAVIKVPKGKLKAYKKLFAPRTGYKKTMKIEEM